MTMDSKLIEGKYSAAWNERSSDVVRDFTDAVRHGGIGMDDKKTRQRGRPCPMSRSSSGLEPT